MFFIVYRQAVGEGLKMPGTLARHGLSRCFPDVCNHLSIVMQKRDLIGLQGKNVLLSTKTLFYDRIENIVFKYRTIKGEKSQMKYHLFSKEIVTCFQCEGEPGRYVEFIKSGTNAEKILCPCCKSNRYTVPNNYMRKMGLVDFQNLLEVMEKITGIKPLRDLSFSSLPLPDVIVIQNEKAVG